LEREEIERRDFPAARRGYDAGAVDAHLRRVADEFETLGRAAADRPGPPSLAGDASERVRAILEAAEASARELRADAGREAGEHVERVGGSAGEMLARLDGMRAELDAMLERLRAGAESLTGSLDDLNRAVQALGGPAPAPAPQRELPAPATAGANGARSDDEAGARLVALNMALEGTPRADTARYLAEHFELPDVEALLDDVYASAGR
jgi:DivIVA domain-containing protein